MRMREFLTSTGTHRRYALIPPTTDPTGDIFLWLHGSTQSATLTRQFTGRIFDAYADKGVSVIYPEGVARHWNDARRYLSEKTRELGSDDVGFLRELIADFQPRRVLIAGFSNGGEMVIRLLHDAPGLIDAAVVMSATLPARDNFLSSPDGWVPTPLLFIHGTADPISPYNGGVVALDPVNDRGQVLSAEQTRDYFTTLNAGRAPVTLMPLEGVGHVVPHAQCIESPLLGPSCTTFDTATVIADFFGI